MRDTKDCDGGTLAFTAPDVPDQGRLAARQVDGKRQPPAGQVGVWNWHEVASAASPTLPPRSPQPSGARQPAARGWRPRRVAAAVRTVQLIVGLVAVTAFLLVGIAIIKGGLRQV